MDLIQYFMEDISPVELFLISSTSLFILLSLVFLLCLFISRFVSNRRLKLEERFKPFVEELLFKIMFDEAPVGDLLKHRIYTRYHKKKIFLKLLIRSCFNMHQQYSGEIAKRLEAFYQISDLKPYSLKKIETGAWHKQCKGIRELSEMNQVDSSPAISLLCFSKHQLVKQTAFVGVVNLRGIEGLHSLEDFTEFIDDWILSHILIAIEKQDVSEFPDINFLLHHNNSSLVLLGLRLIRYFSLAGYHDQIMAIKETATADRIQQEVQKHLLFSENHPLPENQITV